MRFTVLLLALASAFALAADNAVISPQAAASQKPQATIRGAESITIPQMLSYQGKLTDTLGVPVADTTYSVVFRLYTVPSGGSSFWNETQTVRTRGGLFAMLLGSVAQLESVPNSGNLYLGMAVSGGPELSPRLRLVGSAYSYLAGKSADADLLQGKDTTALDSRYVNEGQASSVTSNMIVDGTIAAVDLNQMGASSGQVMKWNGSAWVPRNDSVGQSSGGTVTSVSQATGAVCNPNPITTVGTVGLDTTYADGRYIMNQYASSQAASWRIVGRGRCSTSVANAATLVGINTTASGAGVLGKDSLGLGVSGISYNNFGVNGNSNTSHGVYGWSASEHGVFGIAIATGYAGVYGSSGVTGSGRGIGVYGNSPTYWGMQGWRTNSQQGSDYSYGSTRGGVWGFTYYGDTFAFGTAGYTWGDYARTGGVLGGGADANTWGSLGYKNSAGNWYAGYGTAAWSNGSGLSSHPATGIGCGYGGGLMGGWLKGTYYGATVSGDRYALYTKGNNYTTGYSAVMQNTGSKREASYVPTSTTVDIYTSGVGEMHNGQATVSFPASFASMVSKSVPVVVTATPMGPAPIYLSSSDNNGFAVAAVDAKASVKFSWIAVGRRAGYEKNPEVPAELARTDFDSKMDGVMSDENDLRHPAQPVWFDGTQLRFDTPPQEPARPKPAQPVNVGLQAPPQAPTAVEPVHAPAPLPAGSKVAPTSGIKQ
jgi:hypothetical protein